jgi:SNF2 family DNA or RNA helicase
LVKLAMSSKYLKTVPLPHQLETVGTVLSTKYIGDFSEMGTGKSLSFLAAFCEILEKDPFAVALVVCPPYLVNNWLAEVAKHTTLKASPHFKEPALDAHIHIIPYTQLAKVEKIFRMATIIGTDEGHYLKNLGAKRTMLFHNFFNKYPPEYFVYMTGTPIKNRVPEVYSFLMLLAEGPNLPKITDSYKSYYTFCCRFTIVRETTFGTKFEGMKNVEELKKYILPFTVKHSASVLNLPELRETDVVVSYADDPALDAAFQRFTDKGVGAEISVKRDSAVATAPFTAEYVKEAVESGNGPVVVFSDHVKPLDLMAVELSKVRTGVIHGGVPAGDRQALVDRLNRGQLDVLLCSIGAASAGYNMVGAALLVLNDPPWTPGDYDQLRKRIHRLGQLKACRIIRVVGSKTVEKIYKSLEGKNKVIAAVIQ